MDNGNMNMEIMIAWIEIIAWILVFLVMGINLAWAWTLAQARARRKANIWAKAQKRETGIRKVYIRFDKDSFVLRTQKKPRGLKAQYKIAIPAEARGGTR